MDNRANTRPSVFSELAKIKNHQKKPILGLFLFRLEKINYQPLKMRFKRVNLTKPCLPIANSKIIAPTLVKMRLNAIGSLQTCC